ncbi:hypothetical protein BDB01DRAFT_799780 [Pilobolus umbonatus]|nr:hypothetical protein BDB01DRAFT_799780 [Pilobolus umbonatus]
MHLFHCANRVAHSPNYTLLIILALCLLSPQRRSWLRNLCADVLNIVQRVTNLIVSLLLLLSTGITAIYHLKKDSN